ncbi:MAG: hypothetical protein K2P07_14405, partial [Lachnospiraceae bacterium]|nr:hypothetical protein [Lachnospiraceae bacterium]
MLIYDRIEKELYRLKSAADCQAAYLSDEYWSILLAKTKEEAAQKEEKTPMLNTACMDITGDGDIACVEEFRKKYREMFL